MAVTTLAPQARLSSLQEMRGVAVLLVMLVHAINVVDYRVRHGMDSDPGWLSTTFALNGFGSSGVDLFFVISGFVMALIVEKAGKPNRGKFLRTRVLRIVPLFWLAALLNNIVMLGIGRNLDPRELLAEITILPFSLFQHDQPALVVGWTLGFELVFYAMVTLVLPLRRALGVLSILLVIQFTTSVLFPMPAGLLSVLANPIQLEFLLGIGGFVLWNRLSAHTSAQAIGLMLFCGGMAIMLGQALFGSAFDPEGKVIPAIISLPRALTWGPPSTLIVVGYLLLNRPKAHSTITKRGFLYVTGDASYSIYLIHLTIFTFVEIILPPNMLQADILIVALMIAGWSGGMAAFMWIERPYLAAMRQPGRQLRFTQPARPAP